MSPATKDVFSLQTSSIQFLVWGISSVLVDFCSFLMPPILDRSSRQGVIMTEYMVGWILFWPNAQEAFNISFYV